MKLYQYGLSREGRIAFVDALHLKIGYGITTLQGQGGCPVAANGSIIAVNVGGEFGKDYNIGRIIDINFINNIWKWT